MSWWDEKREAAKPEACGWHSPEAGGSGPDALDLALDFVGALLRLYGRHAFDTDAVTARTVNDLCQQWARHLLSGGLRPGGPAGSEALPLTHRDWRGALQFLAEHRAEEQRHVGRAAGNLRQVVGAFVQGLDRLLAQDKASDSRIEAEVARLKAATANVSLGEIRAEVAAAVSEIGRIATERQHEQHARMQDLYSQVKELGDQLAVARQEGALDPLTGLYNRRALDERVAQALNMNRVFSQPACLLLLDLDHFKQVNDTYGHPAGDAVLRAIAGCLAQTCRVRSDFVARFGGEEFAVILWDTPLVRGQACGVRLLDAVRALRVRHCTHEIGITLSIGITEAAPNDTPEGWIERADRALYRAKGFGRNRMESATAA